MKGVRKWASTNHQHASTVILPHPSAVTLPRPSAVIPPHPATPIHCYPAMPIHCYPATPIHHRPHPSIVDHTHPLQAICRPSSRPGGLTGSENRCAINNHLRLNESKNLESWAVLKHLICSTKISNSSHKTVSCSKLRPSWLQPDENIYTGNQMSEWPFLT